MRILIVSAGPFNRQIGGGQSYTQDLAMGLSNRGHEVIVLEPNHNFPPSADSLQEGTWLHGQLWSVNLPLPQETLEEEYSELSALRISLFTSLLTKTQPDFVIINSLMPTMVRACNSLAIKYVVVAHHPGEVCPKGDLLTPDDAICDQVPSAEVCGPCVLRCKKSGAGVGKLLAKLPIQFHRKVGRTLARKNRLGYLGRVLYIPWLVEQKINGLKAYLDEAKQIVAPSYAIAKALINSGAKPENVRVIHHGINTLDKVPLPQINNRRIRFGFIGRIDHAKGVHVLLKAMQYPGISEKAELHIHGAPTNTKDRLEWERVLADFGELDCLHIHGAFPREKINEIFSDIDVLVLPAIYLEVFGLVVAEALSAGRPVLVTRCGGPAEQIIDGVNGWVVAPNNVTELAHMMLNLCQNPTLIEQAATLAHGSVKTHQVYLDEIESVFSL